MSSHTITVKIIPINKTNKIVYDCDDNCAQCNEQAQWIISPERFGSEYVLCDQCYKHELSKSYVHKYKK